MWSKKEREEIDFIARIKETQEIIDELEYEVQLLKGQVEFYWFCWLTAQDGKDD